MATPPNAGRNNKISEKTEKPKDARYVVGRLWKYIYRHKFMLLLAIALTIASNLFALIGPMLSGYAIDAIQPGKGLVMFKTVFFYAFWMIIFISYPPSSHTCFLC